MEIVTLITLLSGIAGVLGFLYLLLIGDKPLWKWWSDLRERRSKKDNGSNTKQKQLEGPDSITDMLEAHRLLGVYVKRADDGEKLAIQWLIEFSRHPNPEVRLICCTKGFSTIQRYDSEVMIRLMDMENNDPVLDVRKAARKARARLALIYSDAEHGA